MAHRFEDIISLENLCLAWEEFVPSKKKQSGVGDFRRNLMDNIIALHEDLASKIYQHGGYKERHIWDPKHRLIHVAPVRGRLLHHAIYRLLYPFFDRTFYADDFVFLHEDKAWLEAQIPMIGQFLTKRLCLTLHPKKVTISTFASGVDFLGWVHFTDHRVLRETTKRRMMRRVRECQKEETVQSYLGLLGHGNTLKTREEALYYYWLAGE